MFKDQTQQFLQNFYESNSNEHPPNPNSSNFQQNPTSLSPPPIISILQAHHHNELKKDEDSSSSEINNIEEKGFQELTKSNQLKVLNGLFTRSRKFSEENIGVKFKNNQDGDIQLNAKSEASVEIQEASNSDHHVDKSNKSIGAKSYKYEIEQIQSSFMKKIRNLELRIKNLDLNYQTLLSKLKHENESTQKQNTTIKAYLQKNHPEILTQLNSHLLSQQDSSFDSSSSSSSDKINDEWTPIMSKIQEIRFDGQKLCEKIKGYQEVIKKKDMELEEIGKPFKLTSSVNQELLIRQKLLRKYSIPSEIIKERKEYFHFIRTKAMEREPSSPQKTEKTKQKSLQKLEVNLK